MAALGDYQEAAVLRLAACVERGSAHPLAAAVVGCAAARGLVLDAAVTNSVAVQGQVATCGTDGDVLHMHHWECISDSPRREL